MRIYTLLAGGALATSVIFSAGQASAIGAISTTCAALSAAPITHVLTDGLLEISVAADDTVSWNSLSAGATLYQGTPAFKRVAVASPGSFTAGALDRSVQISLDGQKTDSITVSCSLAGSSNTDAGSTAGSTGGESQTGSAALGVGQNSDNRFGDSGGNTATKNRIFVSTQNLPGNRLGTPDWNAWLSLDARMYSGGFSGGSLDMVGGVDKLISDNLLVGALFGYGRLAIVEGGATTSAVSPMLGAYIGSRTDSGLVIDGFVTAARPMTSTAGITFASNRYAAGLTVTGRLAYGGNDIRPFLSAKAFVDAQPAYVGTGGAVAANNIQSTTISAGARINFSTPIKGTELSPFASLAVDYRNRSSTLNGSDTFFAPRIGFGVSGQVGKGQMTVSIDAGKSRSDTIDVGAVFKFEFSF